jgi:Tfp pilus assembly protein PilX
MSANAQLRRQRGAATLLVVMVLFFVVSMVAAYASRNLLFEQKTAANQYRSTAALEAAEAGLGWATSLLNGGRIDPTCLPSANPGNNSFRERYLAIDDTGAITPRTLPAPSTVALNPSCVFNGNAWQCSCPADATPVLAVPAGTDMFPAFRLRFVAIAGRPGLVRVEVNACTRADDACLNFPATGASNEARVTVSAILALKGGVATIPGAALTAREGINLAGNNFTIANADPRSGVTINAGQGINSTGSTLTTVAGSPGPLSVVENDASLNAALVAVPPLTAGDAMFSRTFGAWPADYRDQPGVVVINCAGNCTATQVRDAIAQSPGLPIWLDGGLDIDSGGDIGTETQPVAIVATGGVQFSAATDVYGLIYTRAATWAPAGTVANPTIRGAMVAENAILGAGGTAVTLNYDATILNRVRQKTGSFVVVPGSWRDF